MPTPRVRCRGQRRAVASRTPHRRVHGGQLRAGAPTAGGDQPRGAGRPGRPSTALQPRLEGSGSWPAGHIQTMCASSPTSPQKAVVHKPCRSDSNCKAFSLPLKSMQKRLLCQTLLWLTLVPEQSRKECPEQERTSCGSHGPWGWGALPPFPEIINPHFVILESLEDMRRRRDILGILFLVFNKSRAHLPFLTFTFSQQ